MGDGEARSEYGVALDAYSYLLPGMQDKSVEAMNAVLVLRSTE